MTRSSGLAERWYGAPAGWSTPGSARRRAALRRPRLGLPRRRAGAARSGPDAVRRPPPQLRAARRTPARTRPACRRSASSSASSWSSSDLDALGGGNVQAAARDARYERRRAAARRARRRLDRHRPHPHRPRRDVLYRLAVLAGAPRAAGAGAAARITSCARCSRSAATTPGRSREAAGCPSATTPPTVDPRFARARIRERGAAGAARDQARPRRRTSPRPGPSWPRRRRRSRRWPPRRWRRPARVAEHGACRRTRLAEPSAGDPPAGAAGSCRAGRRPATVALGRERAEEIWRLRRQPEGGEVDLGGRPTGGLRGGPRPDSRRAPTPSPSRPSSRCPAVPLRPLASFAPSCGRRRVEPAGPDVATLDAAALGSTLEVRAWREGDRMRPLGLGGDQDAFRTSSPTAACRARCATSCRSSLADERIAWVAGVAVSEEFRLERRDDRGGGADRQPRLSAA